MRKITAVFAAIILALSLLTGCAGAEMSTAVFMTQGGGARAMPESFDKIEYIRPDMDAIEDKADALCMALANPLRFARVNRLLDEYYELCAQFDTMYVLAYIRSCRDMSDGFYAGEYAWLLEADARLQMITESVYYACAESFHGLWLEKLKLWDGFCEEYAVADGRDDEFYARYMELSRREAELLTEYRALMAEPTLSIAGVEFSFYEYVQSPWAFDYSEAYRRYYEKYTPLLGEIYIELISVRNEMAAMMGYDSYAAMEYELGYGRDYSVEESEKYLGYIKQHLAPLGIELNETGAYYALEYSAVDEDELLELLGLAAEGMGGSIDEAFVFMRSFGMYDFALSAKKADISFQCYLPQYEAPYLFLCPYGDTADIITVFHEFGHYADSYIRRNAYESIDLSESFSQAMQFLSIEALDGRLDERELENLRRMNLMDTVNTFLQQAALAEFELRAYEMEAPTVEKLNALSLELHRAYGSYDELNHDMYVYSWSDTPHFFENPFYVISYPVSATAALELYELEQIEEGAGCAKFEEISGSGLGGLMEALEQAGLQKPMSENSIAAAAEMLYRELGR